MTQTANQSQNAIHIGDKSQNTTERADQWQRMRHKGKTESGLTYRAQSLCHRRSGCRRSCAAMSSDKRGWGLPRTAPCELHLPRSPSSVLNQQTHHFTGIPDNKIRYWGTNRSENGDNKSWLSLDLYRSCLPIYGTAIVLIVWWLWRKQG